MPNIYTCTTELTQTTTYYTLTRIVYLCHGKHHTQVCDDVVKVLQKKTGAALILSQTLGAEF